MPIHRKKRKFEMGRQPSMTKLGEQKVVNVRGRGSGYKYRALKLSEGNFMWVSEGVSRKCKILEVLYNASNNELVRTQTLVKNCIVAVDSTPFKYYWYAVREAAGAEGRLRAGQARAEAAGDDGRRDEVAGLVGP